MFYGSDLSVYKKHASLRAGLTLLRLSLLHIRLLFSLLLKSPYLYMEVEITMGEVVEAGVTFTVTAVFLAPDLYWMIKVKPREVPRGRTWALISTACLFLAIGLTLAVLFASARKALLPDVFAYPFFTAWKGVTLLCPEIIEELPI